MRFDTGSPERGWQPFMDWLHGQGLDPKTLRSLNIDEQTLAGQIEVFKLRGGQKYVTGQGDNQRIATDVRRMQFTSLPPRRLYREGGIVPGRRDQESKAVLYAGERVLPEA